MDDEDRIPYSLAVQLIQQKHPTASAANARMILADLIKSERVRGKLSYKSVEYQSRSILHGPRTQILNQTDTANSYVSRSGLERELGLTIEQTPHVVSDAQGKRAKTGPNRHTLTTTLLLAAGNWLYANAPLRHGDKAKLQRYLDAIARHRGGKQPSGPTLERIANEAFDAFHPGDANVRMPD
jgi:hypothetical protein